MTPLLGFAPDSDPTTPGVLTDCSQVIPYESGMRTAPSLVTAGIAALAADTRGGVITRDLAGNRRLIVGTTARLYEASTTTWTDVSRAAAYVLGADDRWSFAQFGNTTLAATPIAVIQRSTGAAFADIAAAPKARIIEQSLGFVLAFGTNEGIYGDSPDRWWCSASFDETNWTPAVSTQCTTGRLVGASGPITAARRFGDDVIAYKNRAIFVGRYQGPPVVWAYTQVSYDVGCVGIDAVVDTPIGHVFVGEDDIYVFDGTVPRSLATGVVKTWFNANSNPAYRYKTRLLWDRANSLVWIYYTGNAATDPDSCLVYNVVKKQWGLANNVCQTVLNYITPAVTYDGGSSIVTTYDSGPAIPFDSAFWVAGSAVPAIIGTDRIVKTLTGATGASSFTTGDYGDDEGQIDCTGIRVRYVQSPDSASMTGYAKSEEGIAAASASSAVKADGKFDLRQSGRFHRFMCSMSGNAKFTAVRPQMVSGGQR